MRLPFEEWISGQAVSSQAKELFGEAITCYKASAYRAAMLFSYLGFQTILRDRLLGAEQPAGIPKSLWTKIQSDLRDEEKWDSTVYDAAMRKQPSEIFLLTEDLRNQVTYFKDRRNDSAHGRSNKITYAHVEGFWLFITSNLARFVVGGSLESLVNRIRNHFDPSITPPDKDYLHLVTEIPHAIERSDLISFFNRVHAIFEGTGSAYSFIVQPKEVAFFDSIFQLDNNEVTAQLLSFLEQNETLLLSLLRDRPERSVFLKSKLSLVRNFWYQRLFRFYHPEDLSVFCSMLQNQLIPDDEVPHAIAHVIKKYNNALPTNKVVHFALVSHGFFETFKKLVFDERLIDRFDWSNRNRDIVVYYVENFELDASIAEAIVDTFYKDNHPWHLREALDDYFLKNDAKREQLKAIIRAEGFAIPEKLESLKETVEGQKK